MVREILSIEPRLAQYTMPAGVCVDAAVGVATGFATGFGLGFADGAALADVVGVEVVSGAAALALAVTGGGAADIGGAAVVPSGGGDAGRAFIAEPPLTNAMTHSGLRQ